MSPRTATSQRLDRGTIAAKALALADSEGLAAVSMRRLAGELGIGTMTLYGHFRDKDELLDAMADAAAAEREPMPGSGDWREELKAAARRFHKGLKRHPGLLELRLRRPVMTPGVLRLTEAALAEMSAAGFDRAEAARVFRAVFLYTLGAAAFNASEVGAELRRDVAAAMLVLPADEYPILTAGARELADTMGGSEQFELGLEALVAGLEARHAPS